VHQILKRKPDSGHDEGGQKGRREQLVNPDGAGKGVSGEKEKHSTKEPNRRKGIKGKAVKSQGRSGGEDC